MSREVVLKCTIKRVKITHEYIFEAFSIHFCWIRCCEVLRTATFDWVSFRYSLINGFSCVGIIFVQLLAHLWLGWWPCVVLLAKVMIF